MKKRTRRFKLATVAIAPFIAAGSQAYAAVEARPDFDAKARGASSETDQIAGFPSVNKPFLLAGAGGQKGTAKPPKPPKPPKGTVSPTTAPKVTKPPKT